jgi:hypothetical protein
MKKRIYAFYQSIPSCPQSEEFSRANYWKTSWQEAGWECVMLNSSHAKGTIQQIKLVRKMGEDPTSILSNQKLILRFTRWCALLAAGGGWMSDYDVFNLGFSPQEAAELEKKNSLHLPLNGPGCLFYASSDMCRNVIQMFLGAQLTANNSARNECDILNYTDPALSNHSHKWFHPKGKIKSIEMAKKLEELQK